MTVIETWAEIVARSLDWDQAHMKFEDAVAELPPDLRGVRPASYPRSAWELAEHIRLTQYDLLDFCRNPDYREPKWPEQYWPLDPAPPSEKAWFDSIASTSRDREALAQFTRDNAASLTERIPHGTGQTYLRTVLVALDHSSYHLAQIVAVRRLIGAWPPG